MYIYHISIYIYIFATSICSAHLHRIVVFYELSTPDDCDCVMFYAFAQTHSESFWYIYTYLVRVAAIVIQCHSAIMLRWCAVC